MEDGRDILRDAAPFSYRILKGEKAQVSYYGKPIAVLTGKKYAKLLAAIRSGDQYAIQLALAKATGHFKHGTER